MSTAELTFAEKVKAAAGPSGERGRCIPCEKAAAEIAALKAAPGITNVRPRQISNHQSSIISPSVSVVIAALNEHEYLPSTIESILATGEASEIIIGDDCSDPPLAVDSAFSIQHSGFSIRMFRNPVRLGVARTRHLGCRLTSNAQPAVIAVTDAHVTIRPHQLAWAARVAWERRAFVYCTPDGYPGADLRTESGIPHCKWMVGSPPGALQPTASSLPLLTSGIMGALYVYRRDMLEAIGGWPALPGWWGCDEDFWALYCARAGIPILWLPTVHHAHVWKTSNPAEARPGFPLVGYDMDEEHHLVNVAAACRLTMPDEEWMPQRARLIEGAIVHGQFLSVPEEIVQQVETPEMLEYGRRIRQTYPQMTQMNAGKAA